MLHSQQSMDTFASPKCSLDGEKPGTLKERTGHFLWVFWGLMKKYLKQKLYKQIKTKKNLSSFYCKLMIEVHTKWWAISKCLLVSLSISFQWLIFVCSFKNLLLIKVLWEIFFFQKHVSRSNLKKILLNWFSKVNWI